MAVGATKKYLTNENLMREVLKSKSQKQITNELAKMLMLLANRIASKANFVNYSYKEDMIAESLCNLSKHALKFDENRSNNPFAFYTSAIMNSFYQYLNNEKRHRNIRDTLLLEEGHSASFGFMDSDRVDAGDHGHEAKPVFDENFVPLKVQTGRRKKKIAADDLLEYTSKLED